MVPESRVTWATSVPISVFLGPSVLELGPMYATRQTDVRQTVVKQKHRLMPPPIRGGVIINVLRKNGNRIVVVIVVLLLAAAVVVVNHRF